MNVLVGDLGLFIALLWGLIVFIAVRALAKGDEAQRGDRQRDIRSNSRWQGRGILLKNFGWSIESLGKVFAKLPLGKMRSKVQAQLKQAGSPGGLSPDEFLASSILGMFALGGAGYFFDTSLEVTPICTLGLGLLGVYYPKIWLSGYTIKRKQRIFRDLPDLLDTLRIAVSAGLDFSSALKVVVDTSSSGPLLQEFEKVERDIVLGQTRSGALQAMAVRIGMSEINAFVLAVRQAEALGASIGPVLSIQSEVARQRRWQLAEVRVGKLPMKLLGPLVVCIFPASFIILFTPLVLDYIGIGM